MRLQYVLAYVTERKGCLIEGKSTAAPFEKLSICMTYLCPQYEKRKVKKICTVVHVPWQQAWREFQSTFVRDESSDGPGLKQRKTARE